MADLDAWRSRLRENLAAVRERIAEACRRASRPVTSVTLVGVTKYVASDVAALLPPLGCADLAESRPQGLWEKAAALSAAGIAARWHLVGHLQRNKIRRTIPEVSLIHSADSERLVVALDAEAARIGRVVELLVEVNIAADPGRTGVDEAAVEPLLAAVARLAHVRVRGLMGMASPRPPGGSDDEPRRQFALLRRLRDRMQAATAGGAIDLADLSMGMSDDLEAAILEGSTLVRIGSALWEGVGD